MSAQREQYILDVISGQRRGFAPSVLRAAMGAAEPLYAAAMSLRNFFYDRSWGVMRLSPPVISVGNITAGGVGKTPVVRWLCEQMLEAGHHPAVLTRGYRSADEPRMLQSFFGEESGKARLPVAINSDRIAGGKQILAEHPEIDMLIMDDGFQHRRLHRDFDLLLINATEPFGYGNVHPRGLLREPLGGMRRADAILLTRVDGVPQDRIQSIEERIHAIAPAVPIYHCAHELIGLRGTNTPADAPLDHDITYLAGKRVVTICGLGDPQSFERQIAQVSREIVHSIRLGDHRAPHPSQLAELRQVSPAQADAIVTTEKDWQNIRSVDLATQIPLWRVDMRIHFARNDAQKLLEEVRDVLKQNPI